MRRIVLTTLGSVGTLWCLYVGLAIDKGGFIGAAVFGATTLAVFLTPSVPGGSSDEKRASEGAGQDAADPVARRGSAKRWRNR